MSQFLLMTHLMSQPTHLWIVFSLLLYRPTCVLSLGITNSSSIQPLNLLCSAGTRFRPLSFEVPKPLFPVAGVPMLQHHIEACAKVGVSLTLYSIHRQPNTKMFFECLVLSWQAGTHINCIHKLKSWTYNVNNPIIVIINLYRSNLVLNVHG